MSIFSHLADATHYFKGPEVLERKREEAARLQHIRDTPGHILLVELTMGEWFNDTPRARAALTVKIMRYLGILDRYKNDPKRAGEWLAKKESARAR